MTSTPDSLSQSLSDGRRLIVVLKGYPRLSETFIAQEILGLQEAGIQLHLFSLRHPTDDKCHPVHEQITAPVTYLPEYLHQEPMRVMRAVWRAGRHQPWFWAALRAFFSDLRRDFSRNRIRRFGQACVMASELPDDAGWLYAHFIHTPSAVTRYTSLMSDMPWSCSAHAKDIWTSPDWELRNHVTGAAWVTTCTAAGQQTLVQHADHVDRVHLVYHGLDLGRFVPADAISEAGDGDDPNKPLQILTVGRAVPKKGLDVLLRALAKLPNALNYNWVHIGSGPELRRLKAQARVLGIDRHIKWCGSQAQAAVIAHYRAADLFVLPCRIGQDGDRDGLPNVLMEAQSQGLACISTNVSGVPELVIDGETGVLVEPENDEALAQAILRLAEDCGLRSKLGQAGADRVAQCFDARAGIEQLVHLFGRRAANARSTATLENV